MVTVWTVSDKAKAEEITGLARGPACDEAVDSYDLATAQAAIDKIPQDRQPSGLGPYLIAWAPPQAIGSADLLLLNLSRATTEERFTKYFVTWRKLIQENPKMFPAKKPGFSLEQVADRSSGIRRQRGDRYPRLFQRWVMWKLFLKQEPIAFLVGLAAVYYIDATSPGGDILSFAIGFAAWSAIGLVGAAIFSALGFGRKLEKTDRSEPTPATGDGGVDQ